MTMDPRPKDASISHESIWADTVKRGKMTRKVAGLGALGPTGAAEVRIAEPQAKELSPGQLATIDLRVGLVSGRVARIDPTVVNGTIGVTIQLDAPAPPASQPGQSLDAVIDIETLNDVVYVGRPVSANPTATASCSRSSRTAGMRCAFPCSSGACRSTRCRS